MLKMSCACSFLGCLKSLKKPQEQNQNRNPLLAVNAIEISVDATNLIAVAGEQSGEESIENAVDDRTVDVSALEQQQRDELFAKRDDSESSPILQRTMLAPSAPPAPADFVAQSAAGVVAQAVPVNPASLAAQEESKDASTEQGSTEQEPTAGAGASLRSSEIPPGPPSPLARVNGFKNRADARLAGVFVPRGKRPDTPIYKFPNQDGDDSSSRQGEFDTLKGMPFAEVEATF